ncbi:MAG: HAD family hydrolase [Chromatiales bacterium]|nr:HAD family hydrolase [Chromatiales bacterium]
MTVRCITFDLDDTLWETDPVIQRAEDVSHAWFEHKAPEVLAGRTQVEIAAQRREFYATRPDISHDFSALRRAWLVHAFTQVGLPDTKIEEAFMVYWEARNQVKPFPEALNVIERLREKRYILGTITNGNASIEHIGLGHRFAFTVTAGDAGVMKPHPDIFHLALGKAGVAPEEAVHVGDNPHADVQGARAVGMRTIWINPAGHPWDGEDGPAPDATVRGVTSLESVLERWHQT